MDTRFLNGDLDISSRLDLQPLVEAFGRVGFMNLNVGAQRGVWYALFELDSARPGKTAETCARAILRRLDRLEPASRRQLRGCSKRVLNFGYDTGETWAFEDALSVDTIGRLASLKIGVAFTLYPAEPSSSTRRRMPSRS